MEAGRDSKATAVTPEMNVNSHDTDGAFDGGEFHLGQA